MAPRNTRNEQLVLGGDQEWPLSVFPRPPGHQMVPVLPPQNGLDLGVSRHWAPTPTQELVSRAPSLLISECHQPVFGVSLGSKTVPDGLGHRAFRTMTLLQVPSVLDYPPSCAGHIPVSANLLLLCLSCLDFLGSLVPPQHRQHIPAHPGLPCLWCFIHPPPSSDTDA